MTAKRQPKVTLEQARAARKAVSSQQVINEAEDAETLALAQMLEAQRKAEANPIRRECQALGEELKAMGVPWHFGDTINTDFHTAVIAETAFQIIQELGVPLEHIQDVMFSILRGKMQATIAAARKAKSDLYVPGAPEVPPDLLNFARKPSD